VQLLQPSKPAKLRLLATVIAAYRRTPGLLVRAGWALPLASLAALLVAVLDHTRLAPLWRDGTTTFDQTQGFGLVGYAALVPGWGLLFAGLTVLGISLQRALVNLPGAAPIGGQFGLGRYAVKLALCLGLTLFVTIIAVPQAGIATIGLFTFVPYGMMAVTTWLPRFDAAIWVYLGIVAAWMLLVVRVLLVIPATAAQDQYMDFTESWAHTRGNGGRILAGLLLTGLPLLTIIGAVSHIPPAASVAALIVGAMLSFALAQVFLGLAYGHFAAGRDRRA
jgi:hypothetical protein